MLVDVGSEHIFISPQHFLGITDLFDLFLALAWNARIDRVVSLHFLGGAEKGRQHVSMFCGFKIVLDVLVAKNKMIILDGFIFRASSSYCF